MVRNELVETGLLTYPGIGGRRSRGTLTARVIAAVANFCLDVPATFDVYNVRTGERAHIKPLPDGTLADRFARELGPDWRAARRG